jgi:hypothetical protein
LLLGALALGETITAGLRGMLLIGAGLAAIDGRVKAVRPDKPAAIENFSTQT